MFPFKKKNPQGQQQQQQVISKQEQEKRAFESIQNAINEGKEKVDQIYDKLQKKEKEIKLLISQGKKEEARKKLTLFKVLKDELNMLENLVITLEREQIKSEMMLNTRGLVDGLKMANELSKGHEKLRDDLEDVLLEKQEREARQQEINALLKELTGGTEEENDEINNMLDSFERDIAEEKMNQINEMPLNNMAGIQNKNMNKNISQIKGSNQLQKSNKREMDDDLDKLLNQAQAL